MNSILKFEKNSKKFRRRVEEIFVLSRPGWGEGGGGEGVN